MSIAIENFTCDGQRIAVGIGCAEPLFAWRLSSPERSTAQTAYRLRLYDNGGALLWDTRKLSSDAQSLCCPLPLSPLTRYTCALQVWDGDGSAATAEKEIFTGVFHARQWKSAWLGNHGPSLRHVASYRHCFVLTKPVAHAYMLLGSIGEKSPVSFGWVNGYKLCNLVNFPGPMERPHAAYVCEEVTDYIRPGKNCLSLLTLGCVSCALCLIYADGEAETLWQSRKQWLYSCDGPHTQVGYSEPMYRGRLEYYDARRAFGDWHSADFDDSVWLPEQKQDEPDSVITWAPFRLTPQYCRVKLYETYSPVRIIRHPDRWFIDFGTNLNGNVTFRLKGTPGQKILIRYAESFDDEKGANIYPLGEDWYYAKTEYIFATDVVEEYTPDFAMTGFRCVEVFGYEGEITKENFTANFSHSDVLNASDFSCSDPLLCQMYSIARKSFLCNLVNVPTDCPERERRGWTADAWAVCEAECMNFDMSAFYRQWFESYEDCQRGTGWIPVELPLSTDPNIDVNWPMSCVFIPYDYYRQTGDAEFLRRFYPLMSRFAGFLEGIADENYVISDAFLSYKDWLAEDKAGWEFLGMVYFYRFCRELAEICRIIGKTGDALHYEALAGRIGQSANFRHLHIDAGKVWYDNGSQSANAHALYFGLCPGQYRQAVTDSLAENIHSVGHNTTGFMGIMCLFPALSENGRLGEAYALLQNKNKGGWAWLIEKLHITTYPENFAGEASQNHAFLGSIPGAWLIKELVGISPALPGYKRVRIAPYVPTDISFAQGKIDTPFGTVFARWEKTAAGLSLTAELPVGCAGEIVYGEKRVLIPSGKTEIAL